MREGAKLRNLFLIPELGFGALQLKLMHRKAGRRIINLEATLVILNWVDVCYNCSHKITFLLLNIRFLSCSEIIQKFPSVTMTTLVLD